MPMKENAKKMPQKGQKESWGERLRKSKHPVNVFDAQSNETQRMKR